MTRGWRGGPHPTRTLSDDQVREIFALRHEGLTVEQIGARMAVGRTVIINVLKRKFYKDVQVPDADVVFRRGPPKGTPRANRRFNDDEIREIRRRSREGATQRAIAEDVGVGMHLIGAIVRRQIYKYVAD